MEQMIPVTQLRKGDRIANYCGILVNVTVSEVVGGLVRFVRADGSSFTTALPSDAMLLVRVPRPLRAVA